MKKVISIFDQSGNWPASFFSFGYDVIHLDLKNGWDINSLYSAEELFDQGIDDADGFFAACPCTDFTSAGAQYWGQKDLDGRTAASVKLVNQTLALVDWYRPTDPDWHDEEDTSFFWVIENPVGRIQKLFPELGQAKWVHPWEYAGYLKLTDSDHNELDRIRRKDARGVTMEEALFVLDCNAYTKKTGLWGEFNQDLVKDPVEPVRCCKQGSPLQMLSGSDPATAEIRSRTPLGFSRAFCEAQIGWKPEF